MDWYWTVAAILSVWRLTHLVHAEDGPWKLLLKLRALGGSVFRCFYCLSLWIAAPFAWSLDADPKHFVLLWLALSAAAILIERRLPPRAEWWTEPAGSGGIQEHKEEMPDVLLRK
jgi:hypothetical protein